MTKNPFLNALAATLYIIIVAAVMFYGSRMAGLKEMKEAIVIPIAMISFFTLSAAVMGYLFLYQPLRLYFDGDKKKAINPFLQTTAIFAAITAVIFLILLY